MKGNNRRRRRGISLMESLMLVVILGIIGTGAGRALQAVAKVPGQADTTLKDETSLVSKMEQMRTVGFDFLPIGTAVSPYSDSGVYVDVALSDPRGGASPSNNYKQITVRLADGRKLQMMVCKP